jgi:hypothetical protein
MQVAVIGLMGHSIFATPFSFTRPEKGIDYQALSIS